MFEEKSIRKGCQERSDKMQIILQMTGSKTKVKQNRTGKLLRGKIIFSDKAPLTNFILKNCRVDWRTKLSRAADTENIIYFETT